MKVDVKDLIAEFQKAQNETLQKILEKLESAAADDDSSGRPEAHSRQVWRNKHGELRLLVWGPEKSGKYLAPLDGKRQLISVGRSWDDYLGKNGYEFVAASVDEIIDEDLAQAAD